MKNVIIIDDDPSNNILCKAIIKKVFTDADIKSFLKAEDAIVYIEENYSKGHSVNPVILFLDINMPLMSGWEFLDEFKKFQDSVKTKFIIYMLSSSIDILDKERAEANELVSGFISKPLNKDIIAKIFEEDNL